MIKRWVLAVLDWCVGGHFADDINLRYRARLLAWVLLLLSAIMSLFVLAVLLLAPTSNESRLIVASFSIPPIPVYLGLLLLLRRYGALQFCSHALLAMSAGLLLVAVFVSGGPIESPASPILLVPLILSYCLTGLRGGLFWTAVVVAGQSLMFVLALQAYPFLQIDDPDMLVYNQVFGWMVALTSAAAVMVVYEHISHSLSRAVVRERDEFAHLAHHDALTGLYNRARFDDELERALLRAARSRSSVGLLYLDLDAFKPINDRYGHEAGDVVLREIADRLKAQVRRIDTVARLGGDEFAIVVEQVHGEPDLLPLAETLLQVIAAPIEQLPARPAVQVSIGIALYPDHAQNAGALLRCADQAMYQAKRRHGIWTVYRPDMD